MAKSISSLLKPAFFSRNSLFAEDETSFISSFLRNDSTFCNRPAVSWRGSAVFGSLPSVTAITSDGAGVRGSILVQLQIRLLITTDGFQYLRLSTRYRICHSMKGGMKDDELTGATMIDAIDDMTLTIDDDGYAGCRLAGRFF